MSNAETRKGRNLYLALRKIRELLASNYAVHRIDGKSMDWPEVIDIGDAFEKADEAMKEYEREQESQLEQP